MRFNINIEKKWAFMIFASVLIFAGAIFVYAYGVIPNPGHSLTEIQGYFSGDNNLQDSLGKVCQSDGTNCLPNSGQGYDIQLDSGWANIIGKTCIGSNTWGTNCIFGNLQMREFNYGTIGSNAFSFRIRASPDKTIFDFRNVTNARFILDNPNDPVSHGVALDCYLYLDGQGKYNPMVYCPDVPNGHSYTGNLGPGSRIRIIVDLVNTF